MADDREGRPTRRLGRREPVAAEATQVSVMVVAEGVELRANGQSLVVSKPDARRLLAGLLELLG